MNLSTHKKSEVDLRVAQELKNNRDFIYETNQKLQSHGQGLIGMSMLIEKLRAENDSDKKWLLVSFENLREDILLRVYELNQRLGNVETFLKECQEDLFDLGEAMSKKYASKNDIGMFMHTKTKEIDQLSEKITKNIDYFQEAIKTLKAHVSQEVDGIKRDLTPITPEVDPIQKGLDEGFAIVKKELDGFKTEIAHLKRDVSYDNKRFENVYTLIERLQKGAT